MLGLLNFIALMFFSKGFCACPTQSVWKAAATGNKIERNFLVSSNAFALLIPAVVPPKTSWLDELILAIETPVIFATKGCISLTVAFTANIVPASPVAFLLAMALPRAIAKLI